MDLSPQRHELDPAAPLDRWLLDQMASMAVPVADGVLAHVIERRKWLEIRGILAGSPRIPGAVGRWLDTLPTDRKIIVPAVVSPRLAGMLARRGFADEAWWDDTLSTEDPGAMIRRPTPTTEDPTP